MNFPHVFISLMLAAVEKNQLTLTFIANKVAHKCEDLEKDAHVNVSFYDPATTNWASYVLSQFARLQANVINRFCGNARICQDRDLIKKHWSSTLDRLFFLLRI